MNLVLSGPIDDNLRNEVAASVKPRNVVRLHAKAYRFEGADDSAQMRIRIGTMCNASRVDHAYVEEGKRFSDFKLLAMDMDSTLITIECIDEIADFAGKKKEVAAITEAAMRGEIPDFAESLRRRVAVLAGLRCDVLKKVYDERLILSNGARSLLRAAKIANVRTLLVSGGFTYFTNRLQQTLGLDWAYGNVLGITNHVLTGVVSEPIFGAEEKASAFEATRQKINCSQDDAMAIGDGSNDVLMLCNLKFSFTFHGKAAARRAANFHIDYGGLDVVLDFF